MIVVTRSKGTAQDSRSLSGRRLQRFKQGGVMAENEEMSAGTGVISRMLAAVEKERTCRAPRIAKRNVDP